MERTDFFISCDWGTSNFRLRLVEKSTLRVRAYRSTDRGIRDLNEEFLRSAESDRFEFYGTYLQRQTDLLAEARPSYPIVISGMASANIGMLELPYGELPIERSGRILVSQQRELPTGQAIVLISGVKSTRGIMRGEETQALGMLDELDSEADGVILLPGTHSKHLLCEGDMVTDFRSYMTGELFGLLRTHSILAHSVREGEWNAVTQDAYLYGVRCGYREGMAASLFDIRAGHILRNTDPVDNYYHLSGLLIGAELRGLGDNTNHKFWLAASGPLLVLYRTALTALYGADRLEVMDDRQIERALLRGQRQILSTYD
ncbi:2-dehydro-3-deoxygalactonokinase [Lewinella sp. JB7]|uniref:2-dehydro-3-deoxygalactonokinase n=1 Tax=Lewinella sp. JB7 TaxID=2962887 RepID=UPI0020CA2106|nr:2-dehydro-3-deoxygalactonokinase [Lewinella sp. JB7]MCP9235243.1 2-dehydro-3-deoxygalactonokinase [Lewinella sp. JB7]